MIKKIFIILFVFFSSLISIFFAFADSNTEGKCIQLNTNVPFIGDKIWEGCSTGKAWDVKPWNAFPKLIGWLSKLTIAFIMVFSFLFLIAGGILISMSWADQSMYSKWKELILKVIIWIALLWLSGVILHIINPNFFK